MEDQAKLFITYLKTEEPHIWESVQNASQLGLIYIDYENDAVTATNRLLLTYPGLHEALNLITETWLKKNSEQNRSTAIHSLLREL